VFEAIIRTIKQGIPGTAMPAWDGILSDEVIQSLVQYIKTFSVRFGMEVPGRKFSTGMEPPFDELSIAHGKKVYEELRCGKCHGENGGKEGELSKILKSFRDKTWFVYDLRRKNFYKAGSSGIDIYRTLATGLDGSPMNAYDYISDFERWNLVHFLQSLHGIKRDKTLSVINEITSKRIDSPITPTLEESILFLLCTDRIASCVSGFLRALNGLKLIFDSSAISQIDSSKVGVIGLSILFDVISFITDKVLSLLMPCKDCKK
jgi:hypothetical protein